MAPEYETDERTAWHRMKWAALSYLYERDHYQEFKVVRDVLLTWPMSTWAECAETDMPAGYALLNVVEDLYQDGTYDQEQYELAVMVLDL